MPGEAHASVQVPLAALASIPCSSAAFAELSAEILRAGVALRFRARGASMSPLVRDGDVLLVRPVEPSSVQIGDLVLCTLGSGEPGRVVVHRVVRRQAGPDGLRFTVQGDQVSRPDGVIPAAQVYGRVTAIERAGLQIDVNRHSLRLLSWFAALRSRWNLGVGWVYRLAAGLLRRLPAFSRHLE
jgi:signal peptidase I